MIVNGTADPINPYGGGMVSLGSAQLGNVLSSEDTAKYWARLLGVTATPELAKLPHKGGRTSVDSMTWVKDGTPVVVLYSVQNGGPPLPLQRGGLGFPRPLLGFFFQIPRPLPPPTPPAPPLSSRGQPPVALPRAVLC